MNSILSSELVLNQDGSIYHLNLLPSDIAHKIIFVGDPDRVSEVSSFFDSIRVQKQKREFVTHTGMYKGTEITVISTGIGTDNIDIVLNELDALVNIDLENRVVKEQKTSLDIIRIGTSGAVQEDLEIDSILISKFGIGMDATMLYYEFIPSDEEQAISEYLSQHLFEYGANVVTPYVFKASEKWLHQFSEFTQGMTLTHNGFYAPQGRELRAKRLIPEYIEMMNRFQSPLGNITNFEMETSTIYGLSSILGHNALSVNLILANRLLGTFSTNYKSKMKETIEICLNKIIK